MAIVEEDRTGEVPPRPKGYICPTGDRTGEIPPPPDWWHRGKGDHGGCSMGEGVCRAALSRIVAKISEEGKADNCVRDALWLCRLILDIRNIADEALAATKDSVTENAG